MYVKKEMNEMKCENEIDFIHYLMRVEDRRTIYSDSIGAIVAPIYMFILATGTSLLINVSDNGVSSAVFIIAYMTILVAFVFIFLLITYERRRERCCFVKEYLDIIKGLRNT